MNLSGPEKILNLLRSIVLFLFLMVLAVPAEAAIAPAWGNPVEQQAIRLDEAISYAIKHNPGIRNAGRDVEIEQYEIDTAQANRFPRIDLGGGVVRYRYDTPLTPLVITPPISATTEFPVVRRTIWDNGISFRLPLFRGGRLYRSVTVAEMRKAIAQDNYKLTIQDLIYNLTSVYYKISQLEKLLNANEQSVNQLKSHRKNAELLFQAGSVPKVDLLKTDVELAHAEENRIIVKNNLVSTYEVLKALMGMDAMDTEIRIATEEPARKPYPELEESLTKALLQRPDFTAVKRKRLISEERVKIAQGKWFPEISASGEYVAKAGSETSFKENWNYGVRFTMPLFDGGLIRAEVNKEKANLEKVKEEERSLRIAIAKDVRNAHLGIANALERMDVTEKAIESARESLRVETLKYDTGAGTNTDVIDAQTAMLRAETDYYQAVFDREIALAYLKKTIGGDEYRPEAER
ncbi:MAG TPA: TolC family protein [Syntrophorhabdaceae bacterium]|nr:TolC family protein [Syntrophorhabdaceae bacterium]